MLKQLKAWYLKTFLPFEQPDHPLFHDQAAVEAAEAEEQALWDEIWDTDYQISYTISSDPDTTRYL